MVEMPLLREVQVLLDMERMKLRRPMAITKPPTLLLPWTSSAMIQSCQEPINRVNPPPQEASSIMILPARALNITTAETLLLQEASERPVSGRMKLRSLARERRRTPQSPVKINTPPA